MGQITVPGYFNISYGLFVFAVVLMAIAAFVGAEIAEQKIGGKGADKCSLTTRENKVNATRILMAAMLAFGLVALFVGNPYRGSKMLIDTQELAMIVGQKVDHVDATDLADRIIQGNIDFTLIDLRDARDYDTYHIPTAINMQMAAIDFDLLPRNETIILYSGGGIHSAQAWFLFKARGYPSVYMILDGLNAWTDDVLYPVRSEGLQGEALVEFEKRAEVAKFFGGKPRNAGSASESVEPTVLPEAPAPVTVPVQSNTKRKRREGC
jgi:rhodanese-related sulfurtransferase